ncbi:MAG: SAM-dependent methyltransferase [Methylibium sp. NZG]|nr:MAG: SAM-dependent methyltransferase [Methylibium sp. NZG]
MTVAAALANAKAMGVARLDAQLLLAHALRCDRTWVLAHDDALLSPSAAAAFTAHAGRRAAGEPLAYLVGEKEFHGLTLTVNAHVLVPRPETEGLVDWALELLNGELAHAAPARVLDLGTGSGAIALAVKHAHPSAQVAALDASAEALAVAAANAGRLGLHVEFHHSHWWEAVARRHFHLLLSNPPYIRPGDPHLAALQHEPQLALTAGSGGLAALQAIVAGAAGHLEGGGWLLLEHGHDQAEDVHALLRRHGLRDAQTRVDLAGLPRCTGARR